MSVLLSALSENRVLMPFRTFRNFSCLIAKADAVRYIRVIGFAELKVRSLFQVLGGDGVGAIQHGAGGAVVDDGAAQVAGTGA